MSRRISLRNHGTGSIVPARNLIGWTPRPVELEELSLHQRSAQRVITVDRRVLDVAAGGVISALVVIPKTPFAVRRAVIEALHIGIDGNRIAVIDRGDAIEGIVGISRHNATGVGFL